MDHESSICRMDRQGHRELQVLTIANDVQHHAIAHIVIEPPMDLELMRIHFQPLSMDPQHKFIGPKPHSAWIGSDVLDLAKRELLPVETVTPRQGVGYVS